MNQKNTKQKNRTLIFISIIGAILITIMLVLVLGGLPGERQKASATLTGKWLRSDGTYQIEINKVLKDGELVAAYYNPKSIHIGRSGWRFHEDKLELYIELQDENYPGSIYQLRYDEGNDILAGTYYQALHKQTYEVYFNKIK
jgi:hypothetical protein